MFELTINYEDGSLYCKSYFNTLEELNQWLSTETTRPYWNPSFVTVIQDHSPPAPTAEEIAKKESDQADLLSKIDQMKSSLSQLRKVSSNSLTDIQVKDSVYNLLNFLYLTKQID